ncbi:MAG: magnesium transporter [Xanthomonadales bacterium]|nr:Magnesium transporter MgtE [Xanthomonadales bacterium]MCC6593371.1 magnesium transporter [Xanthomonadales bacterium]MCE7930646.1 magnesium transporter [Xanthomonadales bacterium PRO6]
MSENERYERKTRQLRLLSEALESGRLAPVKRMLDTLTPGEIARVLESLPPAKRSVVWGLTDPDDDGEVLVHVADEVRDGLLAEMDREELRSALTTLDVDDLAELVDDLPSQLTEELLRGMDREHRDRLEQVLSYPEDSAGRLMNTDVITVRADVAVDVVLRYLRMRGEMPEHTDHLFVVNRNGRYIGRVALTALLTSDPERTIAEIVDDSRPALSASASLDAVAEEFENHRYVSAPVIDADNHLVGRITVDDVIDLVRDRAEHDLMSMAGLTQKEDMFAPVAAASRRRSLWLGVNLITTFLTASVIGRFEGTLQQIVALAVLMPVVASMGGVAGTQTLTLIVRGLALGQVNWDNARDLLKREVAIGALNGMVLASVIALVAWTWFGDWRIAAVIAAAITINLLAASLAGVLIPLLLKRFSVDPALAGGVALTTVTDMVGFLGFLGIGTLFLL